jgi:uncharacterized protein (DUF58 family)
MTSAVSRHAADAARSRAAFIDPSTLARIKNLQLRAKAVVEGFLSGLHKSPYHGFSVEFTEYRQYTHGDDPRFVDWRVFARSDRFFIKRFEDETNVRAYLLVDQSRSMSFGSREWSKAEYARTAAATIAYFLTLQRDAVGLVTFDSSVQQVLPARYRPGHLHRLLMGLERASTGPATDLAAPLDQVARIARKRGLIVLLSDLLAPIETVETRLGTLRSRGHEVVVMRILDPAEIEFPYSEATLFEDVESGRLLYVDPPAARRQYQERFRQHERSIAQACNRWGIDFHELTLDQPLEFALLAFLTSRLRRGRHVARRQGRSGRAVAAGGS